MIEKTEYEITMEKRLKLRILLDEVSKIVEDLIEREKVEEDRLLKSANSYDKIFKAMG